MIAFFTNQRPGEERKKTGQFGAEGQIEMSFQYFGHLMQRVDSLEKTLMLGGIGGRASSRVETGMSGHFLSCSKGVKDPLKVPDV